MRILNWCFSSIMIYVQLGLLNKVKAFPLVPLLRPELGPRTQQSAKKPSCVRLQESDQHDYETEETLLKVHLSILPGIPIEDAQQAVIKYCQSFPFAAVLPVQPLQYLPTDDNGVEVKFLRKKTDMKSGIDGGIRFFVDATATVVVDEDTGGGLEVTAKRNSRGQTIQKIMAERLVVTAFVSGITGEETQKYGDAPLDRVQVTSLYHKWM